MEERWRGKTGEKHEREREGEEGEKVETVTYGGKDRGRREGREEMEENH